jgi:hypothetical protein
MEHWWNDTEGGKPRYWEKNLDSSSGLMLPHFKIIGT